MLSFSEENIELFCWLVVWNIFYFSIKLGIIIPTFIFFRGVGIPPSSLCAGTIKQALQTWQAARSPRNGWVFGGKLVGARVDDRRLEPQNMI
jgi:hypothetical protein